MLSGCPVRAAKRDALDASAAQIGSDRAGTVITANANVLAVADDDLAEVTGQHPRIFGDSEARNGAARRRSREGLCQNKYRPAGDKRIAKCSREVRIEATANPVRDAVDRLIDVVRSVTNVTQHSAGVGDRPHRDAPDRRAHPRFEQGSRRFDQTVRDASRNVAAETALHPRGT